MKILEREACLNTIQEIYQSVIDDTGKTIFILGEAGIGKTTLIRAFAQSVEEQCLIYTGTCDSLITPRPLGPLFDIAGQFSLQFQDQLNSGTDRSTLFTSFLEKLINKDCPVLLIVEDIHWADAATLDFIKFLTRRIDQTRCLLVLTFRDDEIAQNHPIRAIYGEIPGNISTKIKIDRLTLNAVRELAKGTGFNAEEVFRLSEGNPFYINEILANYSPGIPDNIKDSVLSVFYKQKSEIRGLWELISVIPGKISVKLLQLLKPDFHLVLDGCIDSGVLKVEGDFLLFKHELYRKIIEEALNPIKRLQLNKQVLEILLNNKESMDLSMVVHHARNAQDSRIVAEYAPLAAKNAALHGAHTQAADLFLMAIEHVDFEGEKLALLYEDHSYECYLTNQTATAIESQEKALAIWEELGDKVKIGASLRILSRLNWFEGNREEADKLGLASINELENGFPLVERAKAYSNYAQLKMLSSERVKALEYGKKAAKLAKKIHDQEILCHALNNMGTVNFQYDRDKHELLYDSLNIGLENGYHEHVARAYTNIACISIDHKKYEEAKKALNDGIAFCNEKDLDSWTYYMLSWKARYHFERCEWKEAEKICTNILANTNHPPVVRVGVLTIFGRLLVRKGDFSGVNHLISAKDLAMKIQELQRIVPVTIALLEYGWIADDQEIYLDFVKQSKSGLKKLFVSTYYDELAYWMNKVGIRMDLSKLGSSPYQQSLTGQWELAGKTWRDLGCRYEYALSLLQGPEEKISEGLNILEQLGAFGTIDRVKHDLRSRGVKKIPRGPRKTTLSNPAQLTARQVDVLNLLKEGLVNAEIAEQLYISPKTVDHHVTAILAKLNVHSRVKAIQEAQKLGIIDAE